MALLDPPAEILDLADGESVTLRVLRYERGGLFITPRGAPAGRDVEAVRLHVSPEDKPVGAPYWDLTARTTIARLLPVLDQLVSTRRPIRITKHGVAPAARHQIDFL